MSEKQRLDAELVARGIIQSREQAKAAIMAGQVYVNNQKADKAGEQVTAEDKIEFRGENLKYVSRGGLKLEKAMELFSEGVNIIKDCKIDYVKWDFNRNFFVEFQCCSVVTHFFDSVFDNDQFAIDIVTKFFKSFSYLDSVY